MASNDPLDPTGLLGLGIASGSSAHVAPSDHVHQGPWPTAAPVHPTWGLPAVAAPVPGDEYDAIKDAHERLGSPIFEVVTHLQIHFDWRDRLRILLGRPVRGQVRVASTIRADVVASKASVHAEPFWQRKVGGVVLAEQPQAPITDGDKYGPPG